ncbi:hypothetical protein BS47DRAFT_1366267 [Hydnum rufescens UP504]|uniref:Uncharacterized protein n=1 Tax=Hydnum rufescens UP504 TaxID=1448309 RepID=A0A9P6DMH1_9AGAM|nr:hypothetical protein BS47DRAFT_1366267 [Hydnum rufescens UP504]
MSPAAPRKTEIHCENAASCYIASEDADLDDPDDNDLEQEDIHINKQLESLSASLDADEWLPSGKKRRTESQGHPKTYAKGPDVVSKSGRTQRSPNQPESPLPLVPIVPIPNSMGDIHPKRACVMKPITEDTGDSDDDEDEEIDELMQGLSSQPPSLVLPGWPYLHNEINKVLEKEKKACCLPYSQVKYH